MKLLAICVTAAIFAVPDQLYAGDCDPQQVHKLLAEDGAESDEFGFSVAISGDTAIVGAAEDDDNGSDSGSAYLFDVATGDQIAKLLPDDGAESDEFGFSVAISGDTAILGAHEDDDNGFTSGSAYLFDVSDPGNPVQIAKLLAGDGAAGDFFGASVAISGDTAILGAHWDDDNGTDSGSAYVFDLNCAGIPGDLDGDGDGDVDFDDFTTLLANWT